MDPNFGGKLSDEAEAFGGVNTTGVASITDTEGGTASKGGIERVEGEETKPLVDLSRCISEARRLVPVETSLVKVDSAASEIQQSVGKGLLPSLSTENEGVSCGVKSCG